MYASPGRIFRNHYALIAGDLAASGVTFQKRRFKLAAGAADASRGYNSRLLSLQNTIALGGRSAVPSFLTGFRVAAVAARRLRVF
jgi:hypothetical protein